MIRLPEEDYLTQCKSIKVLGLQIQEDGKFDVQLKKIKKMFYACQTIPYKLFKIGIDTSHVIHAFKTYVQCHLGYCLPIYGNLLTKCEVAEIDRIQRQIVLKITII